MTKLNADSGLARQVLKLEPRMIFTPDVTKRDIAPTVNDVTEENVS